MRAFLFDVDDTLYDQAQPFERAYIKIFGEGHRDMDEIFAASRKYADEVFEAARSGQMSMERMYIYRIREALKEFDVPISDGDALEFQRYYERFQMDIQMSEEIKRILGLLKERAVTGVITNGPAQHQWDKINALGLTEWIPERNMLISGEVDITKPDRKIFDLAVCRLGLNREETYFVGDSQKNDIAGAADAGWKTIWFNRRKRKKEASVHPDYTVYSERELGELIEKLC